MVGYEALLRWRHPLRGVLAPGDCLQVAEDSGLIEPIDWRMLIGSEHGPQPAPCLRHPATRHPACPAVWLADAGA